MMAPIADFHAGHDDALPHNPHVVSNHRITINREPEKTADAIT